MKVEMLLLRMWYSFGILLTLIIPKTNTRRLTFILMVFNAFLVLWPMVNGTVYNTSNLAQRYRTNRPKIAILLFIFVDMKMAVQRIHDEYLPNNKQ